MKYCCDYDTIVHYEAGTFASRFADDMKGKLVPAEKDKLEPWEVESYLDGKYETYISREPIVMYLLYGKYKKDEDEPVGVRLGGWFISTEFAESAIDAKQRLALKPGWKKHEDVRSKAGRPSEDQSECGHRGPSDDAYG